MVSPIVYLLLGMGSCFYQIELVSFDNGFNACLLYQIVYSLETEIMTVLFFPSAMTARQQRLIKYLLTFKIIGEGSHVGQIALDFVIVEEFRCRKN